MSDDTPVVNPDANRPLDPATLRAASRLIGRVLTEFKTEHRRVDADEIDGAWQEGYMDALDFAAALLTELGDI